MEISPQHGQALQTEVDLDASTTSHLQNFDKVTIEHTIFFSLQILWTRRQRALGRTVWSKSILPFISILYFFIIVDICINILLSGKGDRRREGVLDGAGKPAGLQVKRYLLYSCQSIRLILPPPCHVFTAVTANG